MLKSLSKSTAIMFFFDLAVLGLSTYYWYKFFNLDEKYFLQAIVLTMLAGFVTLFLKDNYKIREFNINLKNAYLLFEGCVFTSFPAALLLFFFTSGIRITGYYVIANLFSIWLLLFIYRAIFHYYLFNLKKIKRVLIIGSGENAKTAEDLIKNKAALKMELAGIFDDKEITSDRNENNTIDVEKMNRMGLVLENILAQAEEKNVDIIIEASDGLASKEFSLVSALMLAYSRPKDIKFYSIYDFYEMATGKSLVDDYIAEALYHHFIRHRTNPVYDFCKRIYDIIAALIILTVTFPILLYIALRVKLTDGGNVIYTQNRVGKGMKVFKCYKLRTMYKNDYVPKSDNLSVAENTGTDDRIIPFCHWVRKARFDEIPQMINILKGEMSIVGPRAEWEDLENVYRQEVPHHDLRHLVKAGWTGWSHVNQGHVFESDNEAVRLQYDVYYIKHRNVLWEIGILIKAVFLALGGRHD